ncbi:Yip1 family protein [Variovorax sp. IB41]|uniref:Yip1 family protein n=1 Tax=Variovorax sp. IB41 TaxID=2779370 RepID=UPI0018E87D4C|nr:Yip1 family protein [Variovorax sp. IB41]MBJ2155499.1 YIP1 family protein [Variovorax sp. IB41]
MNLVQRVQDILLKPRATWPVIDAEPADAASLYKNYVMILALIPAVASFIGLSVVGLGVFGVNFRVPVVAGLANMVVGYVLSLVMVFVLALIIDAMAPTFEGTKSQVSALKLSAYSSTAAFVGGIFSLLPSLSVLGAVAALYGIYLLYLGLPVLMKCPVDKAIAYTAVVVVCAIVGGFVIAWVLALLTPSPARVGMGTGLGLASQAVAVVQQLAAAKA